MTTESSKPDARKVVPRERATFPDICPFTGRPFFMVIEHPTLGDVPTYGGPFDSYTIPQSDTPPPCEHHTREFYVHRYDHDFGGWVEDEDIALHVITEDHLIELEERAAPAAPAWTDAVAALQIISAWDCLNPPRTDLLADLGWLRRVVDAGLAAAPAKEPEHD